MAKKEEKTPEKKILLPIDRAKLAKKTIPLVEKGNLCRYLATMIRSGTPILQAIEILSDEAQNATLRQMLRLVKDDLQKGKSLGESFRQFPRSFDEIFLTVIRAGEESGTLERSLDYLGKQILADYYLIQKVKGALLYPAIIIVVMIVMGFVMLGGVLPRIAKVFISSGLPVPKVTNVIFQVSLMFERNLLIIIPVFIVTVAFLFVFFTRGKGKELVRNFLPKIPVIKKVFSDLDVARFSRVLGTLLESGVPIVHALKIASNTLSLPQYTKIGTKLEEEVAKGSSIKDVLKKQGVQFPGMVRGMIAVGEETGTLEKVLFDISDFYDLEVDTSLKNFTTVLEPVLMIGVGIIVTFMVLSIITPIYSLVGSLQVTGK